MKNLSKELRKMQKLLRGEASETSIWRKISRIGMRSAPPPIPPALAAPTMKAMTAKPVHSRGREFGWKKSLCSHMFLLQL